MSLEGARQVIAVDRLEGVTVLTIDDGKSNVLNFAIEREARQVISESSDRGDALVLAGRPGRFCVGFDMSIILSGPDAAVELMTAGMDVAIQLLSYPRPMVAACTGHAVAGGAVLLLACDLRIGLDGPFKIGFTELSFGAPLPSFAFILARERLDPRYFLRATLGAETYSPSGAVAVGFLDSVVTDRVVEAATDEARRLAALPADAYRLAKQAAGRDLLDRLEDARHRDAESIAALLSGTQPGV